ncbi:MAG: FAD-dependent oxidoreductase [Mycolicibacter algericus]|uniref:FAD-dependent oxidoreductase n=1 Tax=Mycolicibacter algericus TaxID=1288388 RepID=UPI003C793F54
MDATGYSWTVIGAGPAGIAAVGRLLDHGIAADEIAWIDPEFGAGDLGAKWRAVSSNTQVGLFLDYLNASPSFRFGQAPRFALTTTDPDQTCPLGMIAEPLVWISEQLGGRVNRLQAMATQLWLQHRRWTVRTDHREIRSTNVVLAVGSTPTKLDYPGLEVIEIEAALDPGRLAQLALDGATVAVFGSSHSSMIALPNLLATSASRVINFYRSPLKYAVYLEDWILFDDTGLKGEAAQWARENIDGTLPERLHRCWVGDPRFADRLQECTHVVYTVGFEPRPHPVTPQWGPLKYDASNGILAPGLFGVGIAFPEYRLNPLGSGEYRVGLFKFMQLLDAALPLWLRYSP